MCHLLLLLPVLALPVFWLWPFTVAGPAYALIVAVALTTYIFAVKAMGRPVATGREEMLHAAGYVIEEPEADTFWVHVHDERWLARSAESDLHAGDRIRVVGLDGMTLLVVGEPERLRQEEPRPERA